MYTLKLFKMESKNHQEITSSNESSMKIENASDRGVFSWYRGIKWLQWPDSSVWKNYSVGKKLLVALIMIPRLPLMLIIRLYQISLSPDHGVMKKLYPHGYCRFHPSCSTYGFESIKKKGVIRGIPLTIWRIVRCNPWNEGGIDLP